MKKILIPGGKLSDLALINSAHRMGMYVISSGTDWKAPAHQFADEYICADYSDKEAMLRLAKEKQIDYMCSCANDFGMISTAYVCEQLGLPGHDSYETTRILHTKNRFKKVCEEIGVHAPVSRFFTDRDEAIAYIRSMDKPVIVKPVDNVASKGVYSPKSTDEIAVSVDGALSKSKIGMILAEPFLEGYNATATSMIIDQTVVAFFANSYCYFPQGEVIGPEFPVNERCNGNCEPALHFEDFAPGVIEDLNTIARYLHLVDGKFHCEVMIAPDRSAQIYDVHRRMSGEPKPWHEWNRSTGLCWEDWIVKAECGMDLSDFPKGIKQNRFFLTRKIYAPKSGIIKKASLDEYLTAHLYPPFPGKKYELWNFYINDHFHEPIDRFTDEFKFEFDNREEMERLADPTTDNFYSHVSFEYA